MEGIIDYEIEMLQTLWIRWWELLQVSCEDKFSPRGRCRESVRSSLRISKGGREVHLLCCWSYYRRIVWVSISKIPRVPHTNHRVSFFSSFTFFCWVFLMCFSWSRYWFECLCCWCSSLKGIEGVKICGLSSKKLLETGFKYEYGIEEMFDGAIQSYKEKGIFY